MSCKTWLASLAEKHTAADEHAHAHTHTLTTITFAHAPRVKGQCTNERLTCISAWIESSTVLSVIAAALHTDGIEDRRLIVTTANRYSTLL